MQNTALIKKRGSKNCLVFYMLFLKLDFNVAHAAICMDFSVLTVILLIAAAHHFRGDICSIDVEIAHAAVNIIVIVA